MAVDADAFDLDESPPAPPETSLPPPAIICEVERKEFVETFTIREKNNRYEVAANAIANRAMMQVNVAKLRDLCARAMKPFAENPDLCPSPKDLKAIVDAVSIVEDMSAGAYSDTKKGGNLANSLERLAYAVTRGAVDGAQNPAGLNHSPKARLNRLIRIGKSAKPEAIDVTPAK